MTFKEIEAMVSRGESLGEYSPIHAQSCWQALRSLYADFRKGTVNAEHASAEKRRIRTTYEWACTQWDTSKALRDTWSKNVKVSEDFRIRLRKGVESGENIISLFYLACTCIAVMTGDETLAGSVVKMKVENVEQTKINDKKQIL